MGGIFCIIEFFKQWTALLLPAFIDPFQIFLLDMGAVEQHDAAKVGRGGGAIDRPVETLAHEAREQARVINVCVREDYIVDFGWFKTEFLIEFVGLDSLEKAAVEQYFSSFFGGNEVLASGYGACGAKELDQHVEIWILERCEMRELA